MAGKRPNTQPNTEPTTQRTPPDMSLTDPMPLVSEAISTAGYRETPQFQSAKAIVMDLGSHTLRAGYSNSSSPSLQIPPYVARLRDPETGIRTFLTGHDALVSSARSTARPAYEAGVPNNPALMERLLDGTLAGLGLADETQIPHPFVMTEAPCQPNSARSLMMELLFEAYEAKSVCFGIDALFSYWYNRTNGMGYERENAIILSLGCNNTHVLPLTSGRLEPRRVKRINVGGSHMTDQLTRRLQLLHTEHSSVLTQPRVEILKEQLCYVSKDYVPELSKIQNEVDYYNQVTRTVKVPMGDTSEKPTLSVEEQARQKQARIENGRRLSEMMREKRRNKEKESGAEDVEDSKYTDEEVQPFYDALSKYYQLKRIDEVRDIDEDKFYIALRVNSFDSGAVFQVELDIRQRTVESEREKLGEAKSKAAEAVWLKRAHEDELISMSDSELSAAELKRKRHIRALRLAAEARGRAKRAKEAERAEAQRKEAEKQRAKEEQPKEYLKNLRTERETLADKIKKRKAAKEAGSDRRSQAARERMRLLAQHAGNKAGADEPGKGRGRGKGKGRGKGRGKGKGRGGRGKKNDEEDDDFGWNDSDWEVYRSMRVGAESDSEDNSADERKRLEAVRDEITEMAPEEMDPTLSRPEGVALLYEDNKYIDEFAVTVDRIRTPELIFQPTLAGVEQCGLMEALKLAVCDRRAVVQEVFLTGGVAQTRGLKERVCLELRRMFPSEWGDEIVKGVHVAGDASLDAWKGAAMFAETGGDWFKQACVSKMEFEEKGHGYLKEHAFSNVFFKTPVLSAADLELKKKMQKQASKKGRNRSMLS